MTSLFTGKLTAIIDILSAQYRRREIFTEPSKDDPYGIYPGRYVQYANFLE